MMDTFSEQQLRIQALEAALRNGPIGGIPEVILDRAQKYYNFLKSAPDSTSEKADVSTQEIPPALRGSDVLSYSREHYATAEHEVRMISGPTEPTVQISDKANGSVVMPLRSFRQLMRYALDNF